MTIRNDISCSSTKKQLIVKKLVDSLKLSKNKRASRNNISLLNGINLAVRKHLMRLLYTIDIELKNAEKIKKAVSLFSLDRDSR